MKSKRTRPEPSSSSTFESPDLLILNYQDSNSIFLYMSDYVNQHLYKGNFFEVMKEMYRQKFLKNGFYGVIDNNPYFGAYIDIFNAINLILTHRPDLLVQKEHSPPFQELYDTLKELAETENNLINTLKNNNLFIPTNYYNIQGDGTYNEYQVYFKSKIASVEDYYEFLTGYGEVLDGLNSYIDSDKNIEAFNIVMDIILSNKEPKWLYIQLTIPVREYDINGNYVMNEEPKIYFVNVTTLKETLVKNSTDEERSPVVTSGSNVGVVGTSGMGGTIQIPLPIFTNRF